MSLISGSNSLTPAIAGALDFRAGIVEKALFEEVIGCDLNVCSEYDGGLVGVFPLEQREKDLCGCSCRIAVRLTVLSKEDMSDARTDHEIVCNVEGDGTTIGAHMKPARQEELAALGENISALEKIVTMPAQPRHSELDRKQSKRVFPFFFSTMSKRGMSVTTGRF